MGEHDAQPGHISPLDGRVATPALVAHGARRLADDLEQPLDGETYDKVGIELGSPSLDELRQLIRRLEDVSDSRRRCGSQGDCFSSDPVIPWLQARDGDHVNRTTQELLELVLEMEKVEQGAAGLKLHEKVGITRLVVGSTGDRAKERDRDAAVPASRILDRLAPLLDQCLQAGRRRRHGLMVRRTDPP